MRDRAAERGLVVGEIRDTRRSALDPEAECRPWVSDELRGQHCTVDRPRMPRHVVETDLRRNAPYVDWKQRRRERTHDPLAQTEQRRPWTPDLQLRALVEERRKVAQSLEMIEMQMCEKDVDVANAALEQFDSKRPHPGTGIEHQHRPVLE